MLKSILIVQ